MDVSRSHYNDSAAYETTPSAAPPAPFYRYTHVCPGYVQSVWYVLIPYEREERVAFGWQLCLLRAK